MDRCWLADQTIGETFGRSAAFLALTAASATDIEDVSGPADARPMRSLQPARLS